MAQSGTVAAQRGPHVVLAGTQSRQRSLAILRIDAILQHFLVGLAVRDLVLTCVAPAVGSTD